MLFHNTVCRIMAVLCPVLTGGNVAEWLDHRT